MNYKKNVFFTLVFAILFLSTVFLSGCPWTPDIKPKPTPTPSITGAKTPTYSAGEFPNPMLLLAAPEFSYEEKEFSNPEYSLPLAEMPENYARDIGERMQLSLGYGEQETLLQNGAVIVPGEEFDRFEHAFGRLSNMDVPVFITSDSVLHLYHIEFNEILKNLEMKKLSGMLKALLESLIVESTEQYNGLENTELKELSGRNIAYLSVAIKLLEPDYPVPAFVEEDVEKELERIEEHEGFFLGELFSKDCPQECVNYFFPPGEDYKCSQAVKGLKITYQGEEWDLLEFYRDVCTKKCYCEDYSQYVPRGHYTATEGLKRYFKSMMWLGRMTFKARGENWTKQAVLLTDAAKSAKAEFEGKEYKASELWDSIYNITGFFAGASDDLTFYEYDSAVQELFGAEFSEEESLNQEIAGEMQGEIAKMRGPKILGGFEIDIAGNLQDLTQGMRLMGQRYALDSHILGDMVYKNVGPNVDSPYYGEVLDYCTTTSCLGIPACSREREFYHSCESMEEDREKYWNEVCGSAVELYCGCSGCSVTTPGENIAKLYSVCRFMPSGLDVMSALGSEKASQVLEENYKAGYCNYDGKTGEMKSLVDSYSEEKWTENLYNAWLWMLQPVLREKPAGYPEWMRSETWKSKDLITALASWAELRHDTILYVKQSYTWAAGIMATSAEPIEAKYYGYVEANPELFARAKYSSDFLLQGLEERGVMTGEVKTALERSSEMMGRLQEIAEKELEGEELSEGEYDYIKNIGSLFDSILTELASALTVTEGAPGPNMEKSTSLEGKDDAFKTSMVADVHTETNSKRVLEVGTGKVDWLLVAHKAKDGRIGIAAGPMFSYYEFAWPMDDRLTDEKWRSEVLGTMERPLLYSGTGIPCALQAYHIAK